MLTKRQNLVETMQGGHPDRFVKQFEAFGMVRGTPIDGPKVKKGETCVNNWGITYTWPENAPGGMPVNTTDTVVIKDIEHWKDYVRAPDLSHLAAADWEPQIAQMEAVDRSEQFAMVSIAPGIFEQCHHLSEIKTHLLNHYTNPEAVHELIEYLTEWELQLAEQYCTYLHPEGVFHHDDWGTQLSTFMSNDMFDEFYLPAYEQVYGYYKSHGAELIVHHSDSYAATLVPEMINMGVDIWQGVLTTNDIPALIDQYGGKITFMGGINSGVVDAPDWTPELVESEVRRACQENGKLYFIPNATQGGPLSIFPGVYDCVNDAIDHESELMFESCPV